MNQTKQKIKTISSTTEFLLSEANKLVEKAMNDEVAHKIINVSFNRYQNQNNWKYPTTVNFQDYTGFFTALERLYSRAIRAIAAFIFFTGGVEVNVKGLDHIIISTKGYYHYIGA